MSVTRAKVEAMVGLVGKKARMVFAKTGERVLIDEVRFVRGRVAVVVFKGETMEQALDLWPMLRFPAPGTWSIREGWGEEGE